jgi:hypothetical protein
MNVVRVAEIFRMLGCYLVFGTRWVWLSNCEFLCRVGDFLPFFDQRERKNGEDFVNSRAFSLMLK